MIETTVTIGGKLERLIKADRARAKRRRTKKLAKDHLLAGIAIEQQTATEKALKLLRLLSHKLGEAPTPGELRHMAKRCADGAAELSKATGYK